MTWSVNFSGGEAEVGKAFDQIIDQSTKNSMEPREVDDIRDAKTMVTSIAKRAGDVSGSAYGHWSFFGAGDGRNRLGAVSVTISPAPGAVPKTGV